MIIRKDVRSLTRDERRAFVEALLELKARGVYDKYVQWHRDTMRPSALPHEPNDAIYRNFAHRGPAFLPWHREFLLQFEAELRAIDRSMTLPYWDWTMDAEDPMSSIIWSEDFMGGNGVEEDQWRVATGPFAYKNGKWPVPDRAEDGLPGPGLKRMLGLFLATLPTADDLTLAMNETFYDTPDYNPSPFNIGFRNRIEGFITQRGDSRVATAGSQLHNRVHVWVGGNMLLMTSPDDPVFFLHHCFIDKIWADWQELQKSTNPEGAPHYAPLQEGPPGHNAIDTISPWRRSIRDVLDIERLGYTYDQPTAAKVVVEAAHALPHLRSPFWVE